MKKLVPVLFIFAVFLSCNKPQNKNDLYLENQNIKNENQSQKHTIDSLNKLLEEKNINRKLEPNNKINDIDNNIEILGDLKIKDLIKIQSPTFEMLDASPLDYVGQKLTLYGYVILSNHFLEKYSEKKDVYYCFNMLDNNIMSGGPIFVYFKKSDNKKLFEYIGKNKFTPMKIEGLMKKSMVDYSIPMHNPVFEGISWKILK